MKRESSTRSRFGTSFAAARAMRAERPPILPHAHRVRRRTNLVQFQLAHNREFETDLVKPGGVLAKTGKKHVAKLIRREFHFTFSRLRHRGLRARVISGREGERKTEAETVVSQFHSAQDLEMDGDRLLGPDIADREIHHAVSVCPRQRGQRACCDPLLVGLDSLLGFFQFRVRFKILPGDAEAPQGCVAGKRKGIDHFECLVFLGLEHVLHHQPGAGWQDLACEPEPLHGKIYGFSCGCE